MIGAIVPDQVSQLELSIQIMRTRLSASINQAITDLGFETFTPVQEQAIPLILDGKDVIIQSKTGTGKTAAFLIPILTQLKPDRHIQTLVLVPTRELAMQVESDCRKLAKHTQVKSVVVVGGMSIRDQIRHVQMGAQVVIGTPGRVMDLIERRVLPLQQTKFVVLDEADLMLSMGFINDVKKIMSFTSPTRQTLLFCVDFPKAVSQLAHQALKDPARVQLVDDDKSKASVEQSVYFVPGQQKLALLLELIRQQTPTQAIIFCRTKRSVKNLDSLLQANGLSSGALHGDLTQYQRQRILDGFKHGDHKFLVATDVASRGLHVEGLSHVFNFELPHDVQQFVHRVGRTGRINAKGKAITLCDPSEKYVLRDVEREMGHKIPVQVLPSAIPMPSIVSVPRSAHRDSEGDRHGGHRFNRGGPRQGGFQRGGGPRYGSPNRSSTSGERSHHHHHDSDGEAQSSSSSSSQSPREGRFGGGGGGSRGGFHPGNRFRPRRKKSFHRPDSD